MISFDFLCTNNHRFEGFFKDHASFEEQLNGKFILCPLCESDDVKRIYTGCSIQSRPSIKNTVEKQYPTVLEAIRTIGDYIKNNFENVGRDFADKARAIHYGIEEKRNIYGESTLPEIKELVNEGIECMPLPEVDKFSN